METNNWYIRGNRECAEQIKKEFIRRGVHDPNFNAESFDKTDCLYYLLLGIVHVESDISVLGKRIVASWKEVKVGETKPQFKPFDRVLGCSGRKTGVWHIDWYSHYNAFSSSPYVCMNHSYNYCLPFEGNEHLRGVKFEPEHMS